MFLFIFQVVGEHSSDDAAVRRGKLRNLSWGGGVVLIPGSDVSLVCRMCGTQ